MPPESALVPSGPRGWNRRSRASRWRIWLDNVVTAGRVEEFAHFLDDLSGDAMHLLHVVPLARRCPALQVTQCHVVADPLVKLRMPGKNRRELLVMQRISDDVGHCRHRRCMRLAGEHRMLADYVPSLDRRDLF